MLNSDKIRGMFFGIMIGDAIGMPVETFTAQKIAEMYGRVTEYKIPDGHKWFNGHEAGTYTDDTQLTIAVAEGLIEDGLSMDAQVKHHVAALRDTDAGWGKTTRESIRRLANGVPWESSGTCGNGTGTGNGVPMKISPVGAYLAVLKQSDGEIDEDFMATIDFICDLNHMTHQTSLSASCALAQSFAVEYCLSHTAENFDVKEFANVICKASALGLNVERSTFDPNEDVTSRFKDLFNSLEKYDTETAIADFGGGSCYCYHSIPFTYAFFANNPQSIESLYDVINAGGDTDSNGSILGGLLGALHGMAIFPDHLLEGLVHYELIDDLVQRFCDRFDIE